MNALVAANTTAQTHNHPITEEDMKDIGKIQEEIIIHLREHESAHIRGFCKGDYDKYYSAAQRLVARGIIQEHHPEWFSLSLRHYSEKSK